MNRFTRSAAQTKRPRNYPYPSKHELKNILKNGLLGLSFGILCTGQAIAQDNIVTFETEAAGEYKGLDLWGLDTAWLWDANVIRGVNYMGKPQTDVIRFSFTGDTPIVDGELTGAGLDEFNFRMSIVDTYTKPETVLYLNNDTDDWATNPYLVAPDTNGVDPYKWAELIAVTARKAEDAGREVISVAPFNEPDYASWQGDISRFGDVAWQLRNNPAFPDFNHGVPTEDFISIMGGNTLNNDAAAEWYNALNGWGFLEEGNTHQLAGNFWTYRDFYINVQNNGDVGTNDELHNVMEAMVGAEYGMDVGIWWGTAQRARGEFVKTSDGMRLGYSENPWNWTAASVYRAPDGKVQAFVGESERQALPTTFRFVALDRPVFYDGYGPMRSFDVTTTGAAGYQTSDHKNAERVLNITWGEDIQPVIDGRYVLVNRASGQVMEVSGSSTDNGANIGQSAFLDGAENQEWDVTPLPNTRGGDYSYFKFAAGHSGKAPDVYGFSLEDNGDIRQWEQATNPDWPYPGDNQMWFLEYVEDGWFKIGSGWSGLFLTAEGSNIFQHSDNGDDNQQWRLIPVGADPSDLTPPAKPIALNAVANAASVSLTWKANKKKETGTYNVLRSTTPSGPYDMVARGLTSSSFTDNSANQAIPYYYTVVAVDPSLNRSAKSSEATATPTGTPSLVAHYDFQMHAMDDTANANDAVLEGGASYTPGGLNGSALSLNGDGYVSAPAEVANHDQLTIATWVYWRGGENWQRLFDFGNGTSEYLFLTPANWSGNTMQFSIVHDGVGHDMFTSALPVSEWAHVAVVLGDGTAALYVNGELATSTATTVKPSDFNPVINYIGKSQWPDPLFNGAIDDFRIYNYALSEGDVAELANAELELPPGVAKITLENSDFEAGVGNWLSGFTTLDDPNPANSQDVPGWMDYAVGPGGIGVEAGNAWWGTYNGGFSSWLAPSSGGYLQSLYTIQPGDVFDLSFVAKTWAGWDENWAAGELTATLFYDDPANVIGSYTTSTTRDWEPYSTEIAATPGSEGGLLGIIIQNTGTSGYFPVFDEVKLGLVLPDTAPPILVHAFPESLSPANHKMQEVDIMVSFFDDIADPAAEGLTLNCEISSSEPDNGENDGNTTGDVNGEDGYTAPVPVTLIWNGTAYVATVELRAECSESGNGRVYTIDCSLTDMDGLVSTSSTEIFVPLVP